jgi:hypothetical protein
MNCRVRKIMPITRRIGKTMSQYIALRVKFQHFLKKPNYGAEVFFSADFIIFNH